AEIARCLYGMAVAGGNSLLARASNMADAVWLTVFALAVAAPAVVMSKYFSSTVETLTAELEVSSANLVYRFLNQEQANQIMGTHPDAQAANVEVMTKSPNFLLFS
ncbi:MAG TPA: MotA/TolQ/ExbB proton channel family protein, partial [Blastocatellia bacterium]|nr:MotA/TolQ/ExbB proton channel family protein [Blastocatellia bacterium]